MQSVAYYHSPLGNLTLVAENDMLIGVHFENSEYINKDFKLIDSSFSFPIFKETKAWLDQYFSRSIPQILPKINLIGSRFRLIVWNLLLNIPYGDTISYAELSFNVAKKMGVEKMSAQAVGQALGQNPISIILPCHRIVGSNGDLVGYAGGVDKKKFLLELESSLTQLSLF